MLTHKLVLLDSNANKEWLAADIFLRSSAKSEKGKLNLQRDSSNWCLCKRNIFLKRRKFKQNKFQVDSLPNFLLLCVLTSYWNCLFNRCCQKYSSLSLKRQIELTTEVRFFNCYWWSNLHLLQWWLWQHFNDLELDSISIIIFLNEYVWQFDFWQFHSIIHDAFNNDIIAIFVHLLLVVNRFNSECLHFLSFQKWKYKNVSPHFKT